MLCCGFLSPADTSCQPPAAERKGVACQAASRSPANSTMNFPFFMVVPFVSNSLATAAAARAKTASKHSTHELDGSGWSAARREDQGIFARPPAAPKAARQDRRSRYIPHSRGLGNCYGEAASSEYRHREVFGQGAATGAG